MARFGILVTVLLLGTVRVVITPAQADSDRITAQQIDPGASPPGRESEHDQQSMPVVLELTREISSKKSIPGDVVRFLVVEDVVRDGLVVAAKDTEVDGVVERVDPAREWATDAGLVVRLGTLKLLTGEEVPIRDASVGQAGHDPDKLTAKDVASVAVTPYVVFLPVLLLAGPFMKGTDYVLPARQRFVEALSLPEQIDLERLRTLQPSAGVSKGYASIYFIHDAGSATSVHCGSVKVPLGKTIVKVLLRPGHYSCRAEKFEPLEFDVANGGTYYVAVAIKSRFWRNTSVRLSLVSATAVVKQWNQSLKEHPPGGKVKDLTKVPEEKFKG